MSDLRRRFKTLNQLRSPDLWSDIKRREPSQLQEAVVSSTGRTTRLVVGIVGLLLGVASLVLVISTFDPSADRTPTGDTTTGSADPNLPSGPGTITFVSDADGDFDIFIMRGNGARAARVLQTDAEEDNPALSPDGSEIAFVSDMGDIGGSKRLYVMNVDGSRMREIDLGLDDISSPSWSPSGTQLAFSSCCKNGTQVYVLELGRAAPFQLTNAPDDGVSGAYEPTWSPDGSRLAYRAVTYDPANQSEETEIRELAIDGTGERRLITLDGPAADLSWSPTGDAIAYTVRTESSDMYVLPLNEGTPSKVTDAAGEEGYVDWSPDGRRLAFAGSDGSNWNIYAIALDGGEITQLTSSPENEFDLDWAASPG